MPSKTEDDMLSNNDEESQTQMPRPLLDAEAVVNKVRLRDVHLQWD